MTERQRLNNRRFSETFNLEVGGQAYRCTISRFDDGKLAEIFLDGQKIGSHADNAARDSAIVASLALQHGVDAETIRHALSRDANGAASGPLGAALDFLSSMMTESQT